MKKKQQCHPTVYARYIFPVIAELTTIILAFFPFIRFTLNSDVRQKMSLATLIENIWTEARHYLFSSSAKTTADGTLFYRTVLIVLIALSLLWIVSFAAAILTGTCALSHFKGKDQRSATKAKNLYLTFVPNRIILVFLYALALPILFLPHILVYFYRHILLYAVNVTPNALIAPIVYAVLLVISAILIVIAKKYEIRAKLNIFSKSKSAPISDIEDSEPIADTEKSDQKLYRMTERSAEEQRQRLRELLGYEDNDNDNKD